MALRLPISEALSPLVNHTSPQADQQDHAEGDHRISLTYGTINGSTMPNAACGLPVAGSGM